MRNFFAFSLALALALVGLMTISGPAAAEDHAQDDVLSQGRYIATIAGPTSWHTTDKAGFQNPQTLTIERIKTPAFDGNDALDLDKFLAGGRAFPLGAAGVVFSRNI